jgi:uncharacterized membrane protein YdjX (TVP38/TMEM64 family)
MARQLLLALLGVAVLYVLLARSDFAIRFVEWTERAGTWGVATFAVAYVVFTVFLLPGSILTLGAGFLYGPLWGTLLVSPVSVAGATLAFLLSRGWARHWAKRRFVQSPRLAAVDRAIAERGWLTVFLLRLSPVFPFSLLNYALGLTEVRLSSYVGASFLGMLPGTLLYVYLGSLVRNVAQLNEGVPEGGSEARQWFFWGGLLATLLATWVIARASRRALEKALRSSP